MNLISTEFINKVALLKFNHATTNAINLQLVTELRGHLDEIRANPDIYGVVITSNNQKFFSIGFDIPQLYDLSPEEFTVFYKAFNQVCIELMIFPKPTIAAINGHAIAGGCILTLCCDYRIIAQGRKLMGLNEVKLGVPIPYPAACILPHIVGHQNARTITFTGDFYPPLDAQKMGLVDEIMPPEEIIPFCIAKAAGIGSTSAENFCIIKNNLIQPIVKVIQEGSAQQDQCFVEQWFMKDTRKRLREAMDKF
jgi:enoyl-CoA hydratase/carnithine racemase